MIVSTGIDHEMVELAGTNTLVNSPVNLCKTDLDHTPQLPHTVNLKQYSRRRINSAHRQNSIWKEIIEVIQLDATDCSGKI